LAESDTSPDRSSDLENIENQSSFKVLGENISTDGLTKTLEQFFKSETDEPPLIIDFSS
jgi:hypothetical protein